MKQRAIMLSPLESVKELIEQTRPGTINDKASLELLQVLWPLYDAVIRIPSGDLQHQRRDRLLLSRGHGALPYYAILAIMGHIPRDIVRNFEEFDSILGYHPDRLLVPGVEISSGSLGQGLPIGVGVACGLRIDEIDARVYVVLGDAELDEGSNYEAIQVAGSLQLGALTAIVLNNRSATHALPAGIQGVFEGNAWQVSTIAGSDTDALVRECMRADLARPTAIIAEL